MDDQNLENLIRTSKQPLVFVGLMGAGKTRIGRMLAKFLNIPFYDADEEIEKAAGCTISEIFSRYGEDEFRDGERRVIRRLLEGGQMVLATGGGAFIDPENRKIISEKAIVIWLDADLETLYTRTKRSKHRPLLQVEEPEKVLAELMKKRYPVYAEADIRVKSDMRPARLMFEDVRTALKEYFDHD